MMRASKYRESSGNSYAETVGEIIKQRDFLTFYPTDNVQDILKTFQEHHYTAGAVIDGDKRFMGLITEREIIRKVFGKYRDHEAFELDVQQISSELTAWDVMITNPVTLKPNTDIDKASDTFRSYGYQFIPVMDDAYTCKGIVQALEVYEQAHLKAKDLIKRKDAFLSYFMGGEPYGLSAHFQTT